jgi:hypothetical protein
MKCGVLIQLIYNSSLNWWYLEQQNIANSSYDTNILTLKVEPSPENCVVFFTISTIYFLLSVCVHLHQFKCETN